MEANYNHNIQKAYLQIYGVNEKIDVVNEQRTNISYAREAIVNARKRYKQYPEGHKGDNTKYEYQLAKKAFKNLVSQERRKRANEEFDVYDIVMSHLLTEGYAETPAAAEKIMLNMSEEWKNDIILKVHSTQ